MHEEELKAKYLEEYQSTLKEFARMAVSQPNMIDQLRVALKASASAMISNVPEAVTEFQQLAEEIDAFLNACQSGEIDPNKFIQRLDNQNL
ncbi:MAG: hypothetical protein R6U68_09720 [Desulfobacteraceae bacterium]